MPVVNGVVGLYAETLQFANRKITEVKSGLDKAADSYEQHDQAGATNVTTAGAPMDSIAAPTVRGAN